MTKTKLKEIREALHRAIEMVVIEDITSHEFKAIVNGVSTLYRLTRRLRAWNHAARTEHERSITKLSS